MEDEIRHALSDKNYTLAQTLADRWLSQDPHLAVAHYLAGWARDAQPGANSAAATIRMSTPSSVVSGVARSRQPLF
jgi:hypothetical protein